MFYLQLLFNMVTHDDWEDFNDITGRYYEYIPDLKIDIAEKFAEVKDL